MKLFTVFASTLLLLARSARSDRAQYAVNGLPGAPPDMPPSWAGRIPVPNTPFGNGLFFWLFEPNANVSGSDRDNLFSKSFASASPSFLLPC